jgi:protein gp37
MGQNSPIEWTHHTFNPWWGCTKISAACRCCYAERWAKRVNAKLWGISADRRFFGERHWHEPIVWNKAAERHQKRRRVFCASMGDVFEDRPDLIMWRDRLWNLIASTPWLDWLLLTKRVENVGKVVPWKSDWPHNVWLGVTVENQQMAYKRIPELLLYPAAIKFISSEPLLGPLNLTPWLQQHFEQRSRRYISADVTHKNGLDWVIAGGESGHYARPMHPSWVLSIRDQCLSAGIPFHFKQWGCWRPENNGVRSNIRTMLFEDKDGNTATLVRMGKKMAGRELDGRTWDEIPTCNITAD